MTEHSPGADRPPISEFSGLDEHRSSPARCSTSLFKLLCGVATDARLLEKSGETFASSTSPDRLSLWSNRPGQNAAEANVLALLSVWLVGGTILGSMVPAPGRSWWIWLAAVVATPLLTFIALQLFSFLCALTVVAVSKLGIGGENSRERGVLFLSLSGLTLLALLAAGWGGPWFLAAAVPWLLWAVLNFFAWTLLLLRNLVAEL